MAASAPAPAETPRRRAKPVLFDQRAQPHERARLTADRLGQGLQDGRELRREAIGKRWHRLATGYVL